MEVEQQSFLGAVYVSTETPCALHDVTMWNTKNHKTMTESKIQYYPPLNLPSR